MQYSQDVTSNLQYLRELRLMNYRCFFCCWWCSKNRPQAIILLLNVDDAGDDSDNDDDYDDGVLFMDYSSRKLSYA